MDRPKIKREAGVKSFNKALGLISFTASPDALNDFSDFGTMLAPTTINGHSLLVDPRYDFDEVLAYIQNYG